MILHLIRSNFSAMLSYQIWNDYWHLTILLLTGNRSRHCSAPSGQGTPQSRASTLPQSPSVGSSHDSAASDGKIVTHAYLFVYVFVLLLCPSVIETGLLIYKFLWVHYRFLLLKFCFSFSCQFCGWAKWLLDKINQETTSVYVCEVPSEFKHNKFLLDSPWYLGPQETNDLYLNWLVK